MNAQFDRIRDVARPVLHRATRLTAAQRVAAMVATTLVVAVTIGWFQFRSQATEELPDVTLTKGTQTEILKAFADAKLTGYTVEGRKILIPRGQSQKFLAALPESVRARGNASYHRDEARRTKVPFELPRSAEERHHRAMVLDLENLIRRIDGVEDVFIHFDETIESGLKPKRVSTAAVAIVTDGKSRLSYTTIEAIRRTVLPFRSGMKLSDVMVIDVLGGWSVGGPGSEDSNYESFGYAMRIQEGIEQRWEQKIGEVLAFVPDSRVVVTTRTPQADLDPAAQLQADRHIGISISVPLSYHLRRMKSNRGSIKLSLKQVQSDTEEQIRKAIHGLINSSSAKVAVTTFDDLPATDVAAPSWIAVAVGRRWAAGVALLIAAGGGLFLHLTSRATRRVPLDEPAATISLADETVDLSETEAVHDREDSELRATLTNRVQNDPDQAVRVLNQWLSRAG